MLGPNLHEELRRERKPEGTWKFLKVVRGKGETTRLPNIRVGV